MNVRCIFLFLSLGIACLLGNGCKEKGCTDPTASNFSYTAEEDNGSCEFLGCTDPNAINFDSWAQEDDGTCEYYAEVRIMSNRGSMQNSNVYTAVEVNSLFVGTLQQICSTPYADCDTDCDYVVQSGLRPGNHFYQFYEIQQRTAQITDTLFTSALRSLSLGNGECKVIIL